MDFSAVRFVVDVVRHGDLLFAYFYETTMNTLALGKEGTPGWISLLYDLLWMVRHGDLLFAYFYGTDPCCIRIKVRVQFDMFYLQL